MRIVALSILALAVPIVLPSPAAAQPGQACLRQNMVQGWKVVDNQTLIVSDRVGRQFTVTLEKGCRQLNVPLRLAFSAGTGFGISCIGRHDFLYVPATGGDVSQRCLISDVQPYAAGPGSNANALKPPH